MDEEALLRMGFRQSDIDRWKRVDARHKEHDGKPGHKAEWIQDSPPTCENPFGGELHFECTDKNCEIYSDSFKCPTCGRRMDFGEKDEGICGDCGLESMMNKMGAVCIKKDSQQRSVG